MGGASGFVTVTLAIASALTFGLVSACKSRTFNQKEPDTPASRTNTAYTQSHDSWRDLFYIATEKTQGENEFQCWYVASMGSMARDFQPQFKEASMKKLVDDATQLYSAGAFHPLPIGKTAWYVNKKLLLAEVEAQIHKLENQVDAAKKKRLTIVSNMIESVKRTRIGDTSRIRRKMRVGTELAQEAKEEEIRLEQKLSSARMVPDLMHAQKTATQLEEMWRSGWGALSVLEKAIQELHVKKAEGTLADAQFAGTCEVQPLLPSAESVDPTDIQSPGEPTEKTADE